MGLGHAWVQVFEVDRAALCLTSFLEGLFSSGSMMAHESKESVSFPRHQKDFGDLARVSCLPVSQSLFGAMKRSPRLGHRTAPWSPEQGGWFPHNRHSR